MANTKERLELSVTVDHFKDGYDETYVDLGYYVSINDEENDESYLSSGITAFFKSHSLNISYTILALRNGAYIDNDEIFFKRQEDAEKVAHIVRTLLHVYSYQIG